MLLSTDGRKNTIAYDCSGLHKFVEGAILRVIPYKTAERIRIAPLFLFYSPSSFPPSVDGPDQPVLPAFFPEI